MKTINCAECNVEVTYEEKEGFPRKYCFNCSEKKKAIWDAKDKEVLAKPHPSEGFNIEYNTDANAETVPMNKPDTVPAKTWTPQNVKDFGIEAKPKKSFSLTDENIRIGALECGLTAKGQNKDVDLWVLVKDFEEYIRNGQKG